MRHWWTRLFGPSTTDRLLDVLERDRAATIALLDRFVSAVQLQANVQQRQFELWTAPTEKPTVRLMTDADQAKHERVRLSHGLVGTPLDTTTFLHDFARDTRFFDTTPHA